MPIFMGFEGTRRNGWRLSAWLLSFVSNRWKQHEKETTYSAGRFRNRDDLN